MLRRTAVGRHGRDDKGIRPERHGNANHGGVVPTSAAISRSAFAPSNAPSPCDVSASVSVGLCPAEQGEYPRNRRLRLASLAFPKERRRDDTSKDQSLAVALDGLGCDNCVPFRMRGRRDRGLRQLSQSGDETGVRGSGSPVRPGPRGHDADLYRRSARPLRMIFARPWSAHCRFLRRGRECCALVRPDRARLGLLQLLEQRPHGPVELST